jgi:hypothetical protein
LKEVLVEDGEDRADRDDGTEPMREHPPESPGPGRTAMQVLVIVVGALVLLAGLLWLLIPFGAS